jgi:hypothetical protein
MMADLKRRKLLFKIKTQAVNNSSGQWGDERHNTKVDGRMHSGDAKIVNLVGEHLQTKVNNQNGKGMVGIGSRKGKK